MMFRSFFGFGLAMALAMPALGQPALPPGAPTWQQGRGADQAASPPAPNAPRLWEVRDPAPARGGKMDERHRLARDRQQRGTGFIRRKARAE